MATVGRIKAEVLLKIEGMEDTYSCLLYTSPSPRDS